VHHVGVAFHEHDFLGAHARKLAHPPDVVAAQVDQHDVLGSLFLIGAQFFLESLVLVLGFAARARSGDRPVFDVAPSNLDEHFGRRAEDGRIAHTEVVHVRRRVYRP
jgi:hypothetical protein